MAIAAGALLLIAASIAAGLWVTLPDPAPLARENPRTTALIEQRRAEARAKGRSFRPRQAWVPLDRIAPVLVHAVLLSEDANFFGHEGIDWAALRDAAEHDLEVGRFARGASTVTQQLAKNLWLGTEKSVSRKAKEAVLAAKLERTLPKRRILALYLNVVELDDGVFGVEAGARHRFGTSAAELGPAEAVVLASMLPAPRRADLSRPSARLAGRARRLLDRLRDAGRLSAGEHRGASAALERILAGRAFASGGGASSDEPEPEPDPQPDPQPDPEPDPDPDDARDPDRELPERTELPVAPPQNGEAGVSAQAVTSPRVQDDPGHSSGTQE